MSYELIIYVPTFNRLNKLKNCLFFLEREIRNLNDKVHVIISDNGSPDGTLDWLETLEFSWLTILKNPENLGGFINVIKAYDLPIEGKFVWVIGDDDYLAPGAISGLLDLIKRNSEVDLIFCNTIAYDVSLHDEILPKIVNTNKLPQEGNIKSQIYKGEGVINFSKLIDPLIVDTLLGELMVLCFRQDKVRFSTEDAHKKYSELDKIKSSGNFGMQIEGWLHQPHSMVLIEKISADTKCVYSDVVRTFNFWGSAEWLADYDYVFPLIILFLIESYLKYKIIDENHYISLLDYYYKIMANSLKKQLLHTSKAKPFNERIKAEMFDSLLKYMILKNNIS